MNKRVLTGSGLDVKRVPAKPATVIKPFNLSAGIHHQDQSTISESADTSVFHAKPAPKDVLAGVVVSSLLLALYCYSNSNMLPDGLMLILWEVKEALKWDVAVCFPAGTVAQIAAASKSARYVALDSHYVFQWNHSARSITL